ncbi:bifunctional 3,4-dihydroxy-2-butanone-4-phosphate synthase/GTP cyclohydrolase II [Nocardia fusca]|uniref:bifunctional 3,4-dihydroxy-2-butanone-4-phosphate synthase/GTP cyclohydrolase II n=1 Tax=Nocardia fusca TaxID=941183 RepID=UPI0037CA6A56
MTAVQPAVASVLHAVDVLRAGGMVIVVDGKDREDEGDLVVAADAVSTEHMAFMVRHTTGIICVPMTGERADQLGLAPMVASNTDPHHTAFTVTVDHAHTGTGVSAEDRARTVWALATSTSRPGDFRRPGHVFPLRARPGGVLERPGHTEAAVDLLTLAGRSPVGAIGEIVAENGAMRRGAELRAFADAHGLPLVTIAELLDYRRRETAPVTRLAEARMPTSFGLFQAIAYRSHSDGVEHLALVMGDVQAAEQSPSGVLVRLHSECLTGDILASHRCDCGHQLEQSLRAVGEQGCGVVIYLRGHEGRGIGLGPKIRAYELQDSGMDTVDANLVQGLAADARTYRVGGSILEELGIRRIRLLTNNPAKCAALLSHGIEVLSRVGLSTAATGENARYLRTKRDRMGHLLDIAEGFGPTRSRQ